MATSEGSQSGGGADRLTPLIALVGQPADGASTSVFARLEEMKATLATREEELRELKRLIEERDRVTDRKIHEALESSKTMGVLVEQITDRLEDELTVLKRAVRGGGAVDQPKRRRVPDPKSFDGVRSAKELENFLWDMEQYFKAAQVTSEEKLTVAAMYLVGDAKLWWRTRLEDDRTAGRPGINTWEELCKELKAQFLPCNTAWVAREALRSLKQTGPVRNYVKEFSSLMLSIKNMSEEDRLFNFLAGLQGWAQLELRRQGVADLSAAMAAAESLVDFRATGPTEGVSRQPKLADKGKTKVQEHAKEDEARATVRPQGKGVKSSSGCFICDGPHRARECPRREKLNAIVAEDKEEDLDAGQAYVNPIQLLQ